jgi:hypothetical protein
MNEAGFIDLVLSNAINREILSHLPALGLAEAWLVSGALFQTVWNRLTDRPVDHGIKDYDIFYFDLDTSYEAEDDAIARAKTKFCDLKWLLKCAIRRACISGTARNLVCAIRHSAAQPRASIAS